MKKLHKITFEEYVYPNWKQYDKLSINEKINLKSIFHFPVFKCLEFKTWVFNEIFSPNDYSLIK